MNKLHALILVSISLSVVSPFVAEGKEAAKKLTPLEKNMDMAQQAFDKGSFVKAERAWKKCQLELQKGEPDDRLANVCTRLGDTYVKESKFPLADAAYKQSIEVLKGLQKDFQEAQSKLTELDSLYRPINLKGFDETSTNFANHVGALDACALKKEDNHHIDINLGKRFQEKVTDLASSFMPKKADGTTQEVPELPGSKDAPQVKSLRLDKKIAFDLRRTDDGLPRLSNIEGIFFDVGLWAKLKELVMLNNGDTNNPAVEITAGAFGVEKKVKTDIPKNVFDRIKEGIDKFDPFGANKTEQISSEKTGIPASANGADPISSGATGSSAINPSSTNSSSSPVTSSPINSSPVTSSPAEGNGQSDPK